MVVNKGNGCAQLHDAVDGQSRCKITNLVAQNGDVIDRFPITIVHREALPVSRKERHDA